jgi:hypothetical protein
MAVPDVDAPVDSGTLCDVELGISQLDWVASVVVPPVVELALQVSLAG